MDELTHSWFHDTVSALAYSFAREHVGTDRPEFRPPFNDLTKFLLQQQAQLPDYLRAPMRLATLGFDLLGCLHNGRLFHSRPPAARARQIAAWKNSRLSFQRDLIRYYESLATFALYSRQSALREAAGSFDLADRTGKNVAAPGQREMRCDIAVIGSGPGGAITACLLAE